MATRFYPLGSGAVPFTPAADAGWEQTGQKTVAPLVRKANLSVLLAVTALSATIPITTTQDILLGQFIGEPLRKQRLAGTVSFSARMRELDLGGNATLALVLRLLSNNGGTVRGTLYSTFSTGAEFTTSALARIVSAAALTPLDAQAGDRLVLEVGMHVAAPSAATTGSMNAQAVAGGDLPLTADDANAFNPWLELSQDLWTAGVEMFRSVKPGGSGISVSERSFN